VVTTVSDLQARVVDRYDDLALPGWADPHAGTDGPRDEEYSRVTDPERYRVLHARARVWASVLEDLLGARVETLAPVVVAGGRGGFERGVRLVPPTPDALPLLLLEREAPQSGQAALAVLDIAVARPDVVVTSEPDCGCDACDSGSGDLLEAVDAKVRSVVGGPFVLLRGDGWDASSSPEGGRAGSEGRGPDLDEMIDLCRRIAQGETVRTPEDAEVFVGRSWIG
jgi:Family of unknown function (DUF6226)